MERKKHIISYGSKFEVIKAAKFNSFDIVMSLLMFIHTNAHIK